MKKRTALQELVFSALSFSEGRGSEQWEHHVADAFNAFGGSDIFGTTASHDMAYVLSTTVERGSVGLGVYGGGLFSPGDVSADKVIYSIAGPGLFVRCQFGSHVTVRREIEDGYHKVLETLGARRFSELFDKAVPYFANNDPSLINVERGVIECIKLQGTTTEPLSFTVPAITHLRSRAYHDLRLYDSRDALVKGIYGVLCSLVSIREQDWDRFLGFTQPIFDGM